MKLSVKEIYNWYRNTLRNPKYRWWIILGTLAYLISPIDLAPDFIPIAGQLDDIALLTLLVTELSQIVIEFAKSRQVNSATTATVTEETGKETVDVNAIPVE
ncbi:MAG: YkvA family protein [Oscillatoria sp. PMC 1068.18]|nr:YkvA family protein [Oscillatoria sp. PMC 1076.18]MEC4990949.1 YkvA family protein [Oscillatoria sp. PMC 1068.18]